jgi:hypothetical protein
MEEGTECTSTFILMAVYAEQLCVGNKTHLSRLYLLTIPVRSNIKRVRQQSNTYSRFFFFWNPILFAICTSTFSKLCKDMYTCIQWHVEECLAALLRN